MARRKRQKKNPQSSPPEAAGRDRLTPGPQQPSPQPRPAAPVSIPKGRYDAPGDEPLSTNAVLTLQQSFSIDRPLVPRLLRREVNVKEAFTLRDATGTYFRCSLKDLHPIGGSALPYEKMERSPEPNIDITLACAVLARQRMIFVMQKATELGVTTIVPLLTEFSVPAEGLEHERAAGWPAQILRAAKQCRRSSLATILPPVTFDAFLTSPTLTTADAAVVLDDRSDPAPLPANPPKKIVLFIGPEGGFSDAERTKLLAAKARAWVLGGRILRAETAVLAGLTAVQMTWGDFKL